MFRPNPTAGYEGYQPDIMAFCTPDVMSCYPLGEGKSLIYLVDYFGN